jgi:hypothetical protein
MVSQFMGNDVGLRKVRIAPAKTSEFIPEAQVDIYLFVRRAVERT